MAIRTLSDTIGRRLWVTGVVLAITAGLVAAMFLSSSGPANATTPSGTATSTTDDREQLRADLRTAWDLAGDERREALKKIRSDAADGRYGDVVADRVERRADRRAAFCASLPEALRKDLEKVRDADPEERRKLVEDIRDTALDGGYGEKVQQRAERLQDRWKDHQGIRGGFGRGGFEPGGLGFGA